MRISDWSSDVCSSDLRDALTAYFRYQYVPAPRSIWRGISKLPPGHSITIDASDFGTSGADGLQHLPCAYWSMESASSNGVDHCLKGPADAMLDRLDAVLNHAVAEGMIAEVPLGETGRASVRGRGCQDGEARGVGVS